MWGKRGHGTWGSLCTVLRDEAPHGGCALAPQPPEQRGPSLVAAQAFWACTAAQVGTRQTCCGGLSSCNAQCGTEYYWVGAARNKETKLAWWQVCTTKQNPNKRVVSSARYATTGEQERGVR